MKFIVFSVKISLLAAWHSGSAVTRIGPVDYMYSHICVFPPCDLVSTHNPRRAAEVDLPIGANLGLNGCLSKQYMSALGLTGRVKLQSPETPAQDNQV